jgi:hypothetical protein
METFNTEEERIFDYLEGNLSLKDKALFEKELKHNTELAWQVAQMQKTYLYPEPNIIYNNKNGLYMPVSNTRKNYFYWSAAASIVFISLAGILSLYNKPITNPDLVVSEKEKYNEYANTENQNRTSLEYAKIHTSKMAASIEQADQSIALITTGDQDKTKEKKSQRLEKTKTSKEQEKINLLGSDSLIIKSKSKTPIIKKAVLVKGESQNPTMNITDQAITVNEIGKRAEYPMNSIVPVNNDTEYMKMPAIRASNIPIEKQVVALTLTDYHNTIIDVDETQTPLITINANEKFIPFTSDKQQLVTEFMLEKIKGNTADNIFTALGINSVELNIEIPNRIGKLIHRVKGQKE